MRKKQDTRKPPFQKTGWRHFGTRLTPGERHALLLVLGLFVLGALVRLFRLTHLH